jgi:hypothetical protein
MAQIYSPIGAFVYATRLRLQDVISPFRYPDSTVVAAFNNAISDAQRLRPDIFLDLKYQRPLTKGDISDGFPSSYYNLSDLIYQPDGVTVDPTKGTIVPIPSKITEAVVWYMAGQLQLYDVNDTSDQRAQAFFTKFSQELLSVAV